MSGYSGLDWRPRVSGVEARDAGSHYSARWFVGDQGIVDAYGFVVLDTYRGRKGVVAPICFPPVAIQVIAMGERLRRAAKRPEVELTLECEFVIPTMACAVYAAGGMDRFSDVPDGETKVGPFSLGNIEDWQQTYQEIERGLWAALGLGVVEPVTFPLEQWLAEIDAQ